MRFLDLVDRLTLLSLRRWRTFLAVGLALAAAGVWLASHLEVRSSFEELLPEDVASVRNAKELAKRVGGDGTVLLMVEALDGPQDLPKAEALALRIADALRALGPGVVRAVESDITPVKRWYADAWPLFLPVQDLRRARDGLVKALGEAKARANPLLDLGEDEDAPPPKLVLGERKGENKELDELLDPAKPSPRERVEERFARYPHGFMVHPDHRSVTVIVRPTGTSLGVSEVKVVLAKMQAVVDRFAADAKAQHLTVGFGGSYPVLLAEYESIVKDALLSFAIVMAIVLLSILAFYRELRLVASLGAALLVAVAVTFGLTWLAIGYLNTQTAFLGSIVAGNGINYGLVYLARVGQLRRRGVGLQEACLEGARVAAGATLLAAVGTSVSFGTLLVATNRGFRHFGFIGGVGMVLCWAATFALLPALLVLCDRLRAHRARDAEKPSRLRARAEALVARTLAWPKAVVAVFAVLTAIALALFLRQLPDALERNLNNLTNDQTGSAELRRVNDRAQSGLGQSIAGSIALLPSRQAAGEYCAEIGRRLDADPKLKELVNGCETVASVVPTDQAEKLELAHDIASRLTPRVLSSLPPAQAARAREIRDQLAAQKPLRDEDAPHSLLDRFRERDGTVGRIAFVRAQPNAKLELGPNLRAFAAAVRNVPVEGGRYDAAGADIVIADLLADIERQGPRVTLLSFACVCVLVFLFFRKVRPSALLLSSLVVGVALMAGIATARGIKINFFNFIVYPITFGIAVDYGANVLARMRVRGTIAPALVEVGPVVALCSWTTIVGYGSLILSFNRALRSFGWYAMLGEFTCLVTALVLLPALVMLLPGWVHGEVAGEAPAASGGLAEEMHGK